MTEGIKKPLNLLLAGYSYFRSSLTGQPCSFGLPPALGVELTNHCNLRCPECASGSGLMKRERGFMNIDLFNRIISEVKPYLYYINLYFQGEPMMHPAFPLFIRNSGTAFSVISTNGHFLSRENCLAIVKSGLGKLVVSIDGTDQETYSAYRVNGDLETVIAGLRILSEVRKQSRSALKTEIQFLVNRINEHQVPEVRRIASSVHASLKLKSMQIISGNTYDKWLPAWSRFRRYENDGSIYRIRNRLPGRCARLWFNPVITWDGKVIPCCFDKDAEHVMGDLREESFREIWNNSRYKLFRKVLLTDRKAIDICTNCTSGMKEVRY